MKAITILLQNKWLIKIFWSIISIVIASLVYKIITSTLNTKFNDQNTKLLSSKKSKTYIKLINSIIRYIIIIITCLFILQIFDIKITSMLAGVGIISIIIGFAIQDALKDIIKGIDIISDNYYRVGDVIKYKELTGKVLAIGLKTTKIEDVNTFNIVSISNRNIEQVEVVSNLINIDVPISYETQVETAEKVLKEIVEDIKSMKDVDNSEYRGINDLGESAIKYQIKVYCNPIKKVQTRRDSLRCIMLGLNKNNIKVPYTQIDIHQK